MKKLISLFLVLVMFLMLAPTVLAAPVDLTANPATIDFGTIQTWSGNYSTPRPLTVTNPYATSTNVTITCDAGVEISYSATTGYITGSLPITTGFASPTTPTITVYVRPTNNTVSVTPKTGNITITYDNTTDYVSPKVIPFTYTVEDTSTGFALHHGNTIGSAQVLSNTFPSQYYGYVPAAWNFYIHNTGNQSLAIAANSVSVNSSNFVVSFSPNTGSLGQGTYITATVQPRAGLPVGYYSAIVSVSVGGLTVKSFPVYYTVSDFNVQPSNTYSNRTLIDSSTGVRVSGLSIHNSAALSVTQNSLHSSGLCNACDTIRSYMSNGQVLSIYNISMTRSHTGTVNVSIPVSSGYNGNRLTIAHCNGGILESQDVYASNGLVTGSFSSLSPFAVLSGQYINNNDNYTGSNGIAPPKTDDPISYKALGELVILLTAVTGFIVMRSKKKAKR